MTKFVENIANHEIVVVCEDSGAAELLKGLGARRLVFHRRKWKIAYRSDAQLGTLLGAMRDAGIAMAGGSSGWPPAAVFQDLRDKGLLSGPFTELSWSKPNERLSSEATPSRRDARSHGADD